MALFILCCNHGEFELPHLHSTLPYLLRTQLKGGINLLTWSLGSLLGILQKCSFLQIEVFVKDEIFDQMIFS
jgi:hypothetical protein